MILSREEGSLTRFVAWIAILLSWTVGLGLVTVDALMTDDYYLGVWLGYSLAPLFIGMLVACYRVPIRASSKGVVIIIGSFGMMLIAMGTATLIAVPLLDTSFYDFLRSHVEGIVSRPADVLAYRVLFGPLLIGIGCLFFVPTRRIWDKPNPDSEAAYPASSQDQG